MSDTLSFAIQAENLRKSFPGVQAVVGVGFAIAPGEIFGLVGPDGAGKTTTLRMLAGVLPPDSGAILIAGCDAIRQPDRAKHLLSYMPQRFGLYEDLTVAENIHFYADLFGVKRREREERSVQLLAAAGMSEFSQRLAGKLSGGMKQKLSLVCALIHRPKVVLLDEPTTGVDPVSRRDFWRILYELIAEGVAILTATAYLDEAERCHRVALMHQGRLLFSDTPAALKSGMRKGVLSVVSAEPRALRDALADLDGLSSLVMTGDGVHLVVDDAARRAAQIETRLRERRIDYEAIRATAPSIEDLFVDAVEAGEAHE